MNEKISATIEDYLGIMFVLERDGEPVNGARLANILGVSPPTVTNTLKRMVRDNLVIMDSSHAPHLTEEGQRAAQSVMRKHMLAEWMLTRMLSWSKLHKEAHELEHVISKEVEDALIEELNNPTVCPHGNPFPGQEQVVSDWVPLTELSDGARVIIRRVHEVAEEDNQIMSFLEEKHISPGQEVYISDVLPFNQTITIQVQNEIVTLGFTLARYLYCSPLE